MLNFLVDLHDMHEGTYMKNMQQYIMVALITLVGGQVCGLEAMDSKCWRIEDDSNLYTTSKSRWDENKEAFSSRISDIPNLLEDEREHAVTQCLTDLFKEIDSANFDYQFGDYGCNVAIPLVCKLSKLGAQVPEVRRTTMTDLLSHIGYWRESYAGRPGYTKKDYDYAPELVRILVGGGADVNGGGGYYIPLGNAAYSGNILVAKELLALGADVSQCDRSDSRPLCRASCNGHPAVAHLLLEHGASPLDVNVRGETPRQAAERSCEEGYHVDACQGVIELLREAEKQARLEQAEQE